MKSVFIYYSRSGNGDVVAKKLEDKGFDIVKVSPKKALPKSLFFCMMAGGFLALTKHKAKLNDFHVNLDDYDQVYLGSPIWNGRLSAPMNAMLAKLDLANRDITFVLYAGGGEAKPAEKRLHKEYPEAKIIVLKEPKSNADSLSSLD